MAENEYNKYIKTETTAKTLIGNWVSEN